MNHEQLIGSLAGYFLAIVKTIGIFLLTVLAGYFLFTVTAIIFDYLDIVKDKIADRFNR